MTTFLEMVDQTLTYLSGFSLNQERATHLTSAINASELALQVHDGSALAAGLVEIEDELLWLDSADAAGGGSTVAPYGRGFRSTTPAAHAANTRVTVAPTFPRSIIKSAINETIRGTFPFLFAVGVAEITTLAGNSTYAMPAGTRQVIGVVANVVGRTDWLPVRSYRLNNQANATAWPTGATLTVTSSYGISTKLNVVYTKAPSPLANNTDDFSTVSGLPDSALDVIRYGTAARLVAFMDAAQIGLYSAEADFSAGGQQQTQPGYNLSRYLNQMYQSRLQEEATQLQTAYPARAHYTV